MKTVELAEFLLQKLYEMAEAKGHGDLYSLTEIAQGFGETDKTKIVNAANYLDAQGLVSLFGFSPRSGRETR